MIKWACQNINIYAGIYTSVVFRSFRITNTDIFLVSVCDKRKKNEQYPKQNSKSGLLKFLFWFLKEELFMNECYNCLHIFENS